MKYQIHNGNSAEILKQYPDNYFDSIVTDPPYLIGFLGKEWDAADNKQLNVYQECLRVLKPGGHILAFSAARTYHHLAITLEQAGFEIRDQIMWIYSNGFPKGQNVGRSIQRNLGVKEKKIRKGMSTFHKENYGLYNPDKPAEYEYDVEVTVVTDPEAKQWEGWGTALKPAHEPICMARKPMKLSIAKNAQTWGTGALNIDATRIEGLTEKELNWTIQQQAGDTTEIGKKISMYNELGRFPSNVIGEIPDYQKYFYCPKVSRRERHIGCDNISPAQYTSKKGNGLQRICETCGTPQLQASKCQCPIKSWVMPQVQGNNHPTVKPIELMKYLIKLVTPPNGIVLDPFNGSGSTGMAAVELGHEYVGCELDPQYVEISCRRIEAWNTPEHSGTTYEDLFEEVDE